MEAVSFSIGIDFDFQKQIKGWNSSGKGNDCNFVEHLVFDWIRKCNHDLFSLTEFTTVHECKTEGRKTRKFSQKNIIMNKFWLIWIYSGISKQLSQLSLSLRAYESATGRVV